MSTFDDFKTGDHVAHVKLGDGIVALANAGVVRVRYDSTYPQRGGGRRNHQGTYSRRWFELHPHFLFHRTATDA